MAETRTITQVGDSLVRLRAENARLTERVRELEEERERLQEETEATERALREAGSLLEVFACTQCGRHNVTGEQCCAEESYIYRYVSEPRAAAEQVVEAIEREHGNGAVPIAHAALRAVREYRQQHPNPHREEPT